MCLVSFSLDFVLTSVTVCDTLNAHPPPGPSKGMLLPVLDINSMLLKYIYLNQTHSSVLFSIAETSNFYKLNSDIFITEIVSLIIYTKLIILLQINVRSFVLRQLVGFAIWLLNLLISRHDVYLLRLFSL